MQLHNEEETKQDRVGFVFSTPTHKHECVRGGLQWLAYYGSAVRAVRARDDDTSSNSGVMLSRQSLSVRVVAIKRGESLFTSPLLFFGCVRLCRAEISGRRAELCSSVLAPVRNPGWTEK